MKDAGYNPFGVHMDLTTRERRPTWELAEDWPYQGDWTLEQYLRLGTGRAVEFVDGFLEFLPMPNEIHQDIIEYIYFAIKAILQRRGNGVAKFAPFKVQVDEKHVREPDVCVLLDSDDPRRGQDYWAGADLVVEVVSEDDPQRDYVEKRSEYAFGGIQEYWIVDPQTQAITLLRLDAGTYAEVGVFRAGDVVPSRVVPDFRLDVAACFAVAANAARTRKPLTRR